MDATLGQILSELYQIIAERDRLRAENEQLRKVLDSALPVREADATSLVGASDGVPNDH